MPVNQGSGFNYVQTNPYDFNDWGGTMGGGHDGSSSLGTRGTVGGTGGNYVIQNASSQIRAAYDAGAASGEELGYWVIGMHQKASRWSQLLTIRPASPQTYAPGFPMPGSGVLFRWTPAGATQWAFGGDSGTSNSGPYYAPPPFADNQTNPPFIIFDNQINQPAPGGRTTKARIMVFHSSGTMIAQKKMQTAEIEATSRFVAYTNNFDGGTTSAWDMEPIAGGSNYNFDQVSIPSP